MTRGCGGWLGLDDLPDAGATAPRAVRAGHARATRREPRVKRPMGRSPGTTQRAQRKPMPLKWRDGSRRASASKTPAPEPSTKLPPRMYAPGSELLPPPPDPPKQLKSPPGMSGAEVVQRVQLFARSPQSATHSFTFPTMSKTPQLDLQLDREPVFTG